MAKNKTKPDYEGYDPYGSQSITIDPSTGAFVSTGSNSPQSTTGDIDGSGKGWLSSLWNKWTGAGTTGQQDELNAFESAQAQQNRDWQSVEADKNRRFQAEQAQLDYDRQVEFYEQYQSIGAQMRQYKEAGLNPALLADGVQPSSSAPSASVPVGSTPSGSAAHATSPMSSPSGFAGFMGQILNLLKLRSEIDVNKSVSRKNIADAGKTDKETSWIDILSNMDVAEAQQKIKESNQRIDKMLVDMQKSLSDIDVNNKTLEIGDARISLMGTQEELNATQSILNKLKANEMSLLMPYVQARAEAEIALINAQTEESRMSAERQMYEANVAILEGMKEAHLIDQGYYDNLVGKSYWEAKNEKREFHFKPANDICSNISKVCLGVGSLIGAFKGTSGMPLTSIISSGGAELAAEIPDLFL